MRLCLQITGALLAALLGATAVLADDHGSISGIVVDSSGAVLPGAKVSAHHQQTAFLFSESTDAEGRFRLVSLPLGTYTVIVEHAGFAVLTLKPIEVTVGAKIDFTLALRIGPRSEVVDSVASSPGVETTSTQLTSTVDERYVSSLPANGRNFRDMVSLTPGVVVGGGGAVTFGGQRTHNSMLVDGVENNFRFSGEPYLDRGPPYQYSLDVVGEFQVKSNGYAAEFGRVANGVVNVATRSGDNRFRGGLFWYFRDRGLNATDPERKLAGESKEPLHVHQFGGSVGGPIRRDRLFFFGNYEGQRRREQNPTALTLPSTFRISTNPAIAQAQQSALDYLAARSTSWLRTYDQNSVFARLDWHSNSRQLWTTRWNGSYFDGRNAAGVSGAQESLEHNGTVRSDSNSVAASYTHILSPETVNVARFHYFRQHELRGANVIEPQANVFESGQLLLTIGRNAANPQDLMLHQTQLADSLTLVRGGHTWKMGVDVLFARIAWTQAQNSFGSFRFNSLESFGRSLSGSPQPVAGDQYVQAFVAQSQTSVHPNSSEYAVFMQDEWRATRGLTLNFGLRYDAQLLAHAPVRNPSAQLAAANLDTSVTPFDANNFAPRVGFAWSPFRSQRFVVRGAYGWFYGWTRGAMAARSHFMNGLTVQTRTFTAGTPSAAFIPSYPRTICGEPDPAGSVPQCAAPLVANETIMLFSKGYVQPRDHHASFGVEYELHKDVAVSATYLMVKGRDLPRWEDVNLAAPTQAAIGIAGSSETLAYWRYSSLRPVAGFDRILRLDSRASSDYQALALQVRKRFSGGFHFLAACTLAQVTDDSPEALVFNPGGSTDAFLLSDSGRPETDWGPGVFDARQRLSLGGSWELGRHQALPTLPRFLLSDWELSGIFAVQTGLPYSARVSFDLNNDGNSFNDRPPGMARNSLRLSTWVSLDPRVTRTVRLREKFRLQLVAEAFNVLNHSNYSGVRNTQYARTTSTSACAPAIAPCLLPQLTGPTAFGLPNASTGARVVQFAAKLQF